MLQISVGRVSKNKRKMNQPFSHPMSIRKEVHLLYQDVINEPSC